MKEYHYVKLAELDKLSHAVDENLKVNIYAFVVSFEILSRSTAMLEDDSVVTQLEIRDDSSDSSNTTCIIYSEQLENFADQIRSGQIIRMHRARVIGQINGSFAPLYKSSVKFTLVPDYRKKITSLRMLFMKDQPISVEGPSTTSGSQKVSDDELIATASVLPEDRILAYGSKDEINEIIENANVNNLDELILGHYTDIIVQAVALLIGDRNNVILRCWDTTLPPRKIFALNADFINEIIWRDEKTEGIAENYLCDVVLYEEHANFARNNVKFGDILLLINTHLYHSKNGVTLTMHGGGRCYNRSIIILDDDNQLKLKLLCNVDRFISKKVSVCSDLQKDGSNINDVQHGTYAVVQETNMCENGSTELSNCWAGERMRQIYAVQLAWIRSYIWKKKQQTNLQLHRSLNLATMGVQFTIRQILERLFVYNKGKLFLFFHRASHC
uniref:Protection of telomeres protein 1 ssDNA-binding domain-containing protein n=1 Tax=Setaria digitata TaxID=48799 RepID=A0A915PY11_9BILA